MFLIGVSFSSSPIDFDSCGKGSSPLVTANKEVKHSMVMFGDYVKYADGCEEQAKEHLKAELHAFIDKLCDDESFFIKCERDKTGKDILRQSNTLAWKIAIPHMERKD